MGSVNCPRLSIPHIERNGASRSQVGLPQRDFIHVIRVAPIIKPPRILHPETDAVGLFGQPVRVAAFSEYINVHRGEASGVGKPYNDSVVVIVNGQRPACSNRCVRLGPTVSKDTQRFSCKVRYVRESVFYSLNIPC